jgi:hypothetical protein
MEVVPEREGLRTELRQLKGAMARRPAQVLVLAVPPLRPSVGGRQALALASFFTFKLLAFFRFLTIILFLTDF